MFYICRFLLCGAAMAGCLAQENQYSWYYSDTCFVSWINKAKYYMQFKQLVVTLFVIFSSYNRSTIKQLLTILNNVAKYVYVPNPLGS